MKDIYNIDWIILLNPISFLDLWLFFFIILFLFLFYKFVNKKELKEEINLEKVEKIDYLSKIKSISDKYFLKDVSYIFRVFLEKEKKYKNFSKLTLEEILEKKEVENKYKTFLEHIYFKEYNWEILDKKEREDIISELKEILKNW